MQLNIRKLPEAWGYVSSQVLVSLLEPVVFLDIVEVITTDDQGPFHLQTMNNSSQDSSSNAHVTSEWAFLVNVSPLNGLYKKMKL